MIKAAYCFLKIGWKTEDELWNSFYLLSRYDSSPSHSDVVVCSVNCTVFDVLPSYEKEGIHGTWRLLRRSFNF